MARHVARRDEKPRPGNCRTGNHPLRKQQATSAVTASRRVAVADMAKSSIDIAESLARLSAATIFELRGEWRRLHRAPIDDDLASLIARAAATPNMFLAVRETASTPWRRGLASGAIMWRCSCVSLISLLKSLARSWSANSPPARLALLSRTLPHDWQEQRRLLGFAPA
jgi:hypothetical protein